jgi:hypothetical protein
MLEKRRQLTEDWSVFVSSNSSGSLPRIAEKTGKAGLAGLVLPSFLHRG